MEIQNNPPYRKFEDRRKKEMRGDRDKDFLNTSARSQDMEEYIRGILGEQHLEDSTLLPLSIIYRYNVAFSKNKSACNEY